MAKYMWGQARPTQQTYVLLPSLLPPLLPPPSSGTRLSSNVQTAAAIFALLNDFRLSQRKNTLGWVNILLYDAIQLWESGGIKDIIGGNNGGCGTVGFFAVPGWDPVRPARPLFLRVQLSLISSPTGHRPRVSELYNSRDRGGMVAVDILNTVQHKHFHSLPCQLWHEL